MKPRLGKTTAARLADFKTGTGEYHGERERAGEQKARVHASMAAGRLARHRSLFLRPYAGLTQRQAAMRDAAMLEPYVGAKEAWRLAWRFWRGVADHELVERHGPSDDAVAAHNSDVRTWTGEGE